MNAIAPPSLRHIVLLAFKPEASADAVDAVIAGFGRLPQAISQIVSYESGANVSPEGLNDGYTHCFTLTFLSVQDREAYLAHPAHIAFAATLDTAVHKALMVAYWVH